MEKGILAVLLTVFLLSPCRSAWASHASLGAGIGHSGPVTTVSPTTMQKGQWYSEIVFEYQKYDTFSESELLGFAENGNPGVHNMKSLSNTYLGLAYAVTDDFMLHLRIPYASRNDISELHNGENVHTESLLRRTSHEEEEHAGELTSLGDSRGIGDLTLRAHYRLYKNKESDMESTALLGLKIPTGKTSEKADNGERFEAEFQPGSGSWDPSVGIAFRKGFGSFSLDTNVEYVFVKKGTQDTGLGDAFNYNVAFSYKALRGATSLDLILEANGIWKAEEKAGGVKDENSGGNIIFISPGVRLILGSRFNAFASIGFPVLQDLNGKQNDTDYRAVFGFNFSF